MTQPSPSAVHQPLALIAELTHRCPLHCVYCSNPIELQARASELTTDVWKRIFDEAADLGVVQLHLTGGEPTARDDLPELIRHGRARKLYINLITSGMSLTEKKLSILCDSGLDHVQISFQDSDESSANEIAGAKAHARKIQTARLIKKFSLAFTMNIVVHRQNLARLPEMIALGEELGVDRLEIAHVQYYGWAFRNRALLIPTREQVRDSMALIESTRTRLKGKLRIDFVVPDYFARFPKPCMGGWGKTSLLVDPAGRVLPCHSAMVLPGMSFESAAEKPLRWIWEESDSFQRYRGEEWMKEPCASCERRARDFGGCRCQAFMITQDAQATDPVCSLSPQRALIDEALGRVETDRKWIYRKSGMSDGRSDGSSALE